MKKFLSIILTLIFIFSLTACSNDGQKKTRKAELNPQILVNSEETASENEDTGAESENTDQSDISDVSSFEEFVEKMDEEGYRVKETENDDGVTVIEINNPKEEKEASKKGTDSKKKPSTTEKPTIPTIDNLPTPEKPAKPEKNETDSDTSSKDTTSKEPAPTPEEPEPQPSPETDTSTEQAPEKPEEQKPTYTYTTGQKHIKLHYSKRYLYSLLDSEKKVWYQKIDAAVNNLEEEVALDGNLSENRNYYIYYLYMMDNPEHFYLSNTVGIYNSGDGKGKLLFSYSVSNKKGEYSGYGYGKLTDQLREKIKTKKAAFEKEANRILSTIPSDAPDVWKEKLIYDRILIDSYYNSSAQWDGLANDNWTAYGILVNKYGVCESYSEAFQTLCLYAGIECIGVVGYAGGGHKWNCVKLDGEWYMCDITFDDPIGGEAGAAYHYYFNLTSKRMTELNHDWSSSEYSVPECTGTKYSYYDYFE